MRVLYFHQHFSTPKGATGIRSYQMAKRLIHHGHQVTMVCGSYGGGSTELTGLFVNGKRQGKVDGIDIIEFDLAYSNKDGFLKRFNTFIRFAAKSIGLAFTENYDVLFATTTPLTAGIPGIFARWFRKKPFVFEVRDLWPELPREMGVITNPVILQLMSFLEWLSYRSANRCIGLSPGIVDGIKKQGVKDESVTLVPNGCDLSIFSQDVEGYRPVGVETTDLMAIFAGTHGIANGLDAILNVAKELKKREINNVKIVLIGQGKLKPQLQSRAKAENLNNVIFHDPVNKETLVKFMKSADIGLQLLANVPAFYYGTSPNKFFDYISAGLPVLNNYPGWLADIIKEHECGYSIAPDNIVEFANALEHAANNKPGLLLMGENAYRLGKKEFSREELADRWVQWLEGVGET